MVFHSVPRAVSVAPPSAVTVAPRAADVVPMLLTLGVVTSRWTGPVGRDLRALVQPFALHLAALVAVLSSAAAAPSLTPAEVEFFENKDVCVAEVRKLGDTLHDEHLAAREMLVQVRGAGGTAPSVGVSPKLSATPGAVGADASEAGADTREALGAAGLAQKKIKDLFKSGAAAEPSGE